MSLRDHARVELEAAGLFDKDSDYGGMLGDSVMELVDKFADQGHSGFSAYLCIDLFSRVAKYEPLTPLTGKPDEWVEAGEEGGEILYQNKRCSTVFKVGNAQAYNIDGKIFREPDGACYTNKDSRTLITFPYTPTTEYINVPEQ